MKHRFHHVIAIGSRKFRVHQAGKQVAVAAGKLVRLHGQLGLLGAVIFILDGSIKTSLNAVLIQFVDASTVAKSGHRANLLRIEGKHFIYQ